MKRLLVITIALLIGTGSVALAEDEWAKGVPADKQKQANALFAEANDLLARQSHAPALEKYRAALALWDHPLIRFNAAYAEIRLDRILEAAEDLDKALKFGQAPFPTKELYQQALDYQTLIKGRVGDVAVSCTQAKVHVSLDGKPWFNCPGTQSQRVLTGEHVVLGEDDTKDLVPESRRIVVGAANTTTQKLDLRRFDSAVVLKYPYPRWIPFTIAGGGAAIALGGLAFWFAGRNQMDKFEADFAMACPTGCDAALNMTAQEKLLAEERDSAKLKGKIAVSMMIAGGAITVTGVVMAIINSKAKRVLPAVEVTPNANGGATASWHHSF
jgi:hypothetical protein